jgi:hypothetical protein
LFASSGIEPEVIAESGRLIAKGAEVKRRVMPGWGWVAAATDQDADLVLVDNFR